MEADTPRIALLGSAELDDVRAQLEALGIQYCDASRVDFGASVPLLITSAAGARELAAGRVDAPRHLLHVAICDDPEERSGADLVLLKPVSDTVLRQLSRRREREDSERRLATRVALEVPVKVECDGDRRELILDRISIRGCGLMSPARVRPDAEVEIQVPGELTAPRELALTGRVRDCREVAEGDGYDVTVIFDALELGDRVTLRALMSRHAVDYQPTSEGSERTRRALSERMRECATERRINPRRRFQRRVVATCDGHGLVLMGRDLSVEGVRVERHDQLSPGDALRLALFDEPTAPPLLIDAVVHRDDGSEGTYLHWDPPPEPLRDRLKAMLQTLAPMDLDEKS